MPIPLYGLDDVKALFAADMWDYATPLCRTRVAALNLSRGDVVEIVSALNVEKDYRGVFECDTDYGHVTADDYTIWFNEEADARCRCRPDHGTKFYVKFAIQQQTHGTFLLVVQLHLAQY